MTDAERDALGGYVREIADLIELRDWRFIISPRPSDEGDSAQIQTTYGRKLAEIKVSEDWQERPADERRHTITHELLHAHLDPAHRVLANVALNIGDNLYRVLQEGHRDAIEFAVDAIADALAPHLPLPLPLPLPTNANG